jgi:MoxR-like ATPase
MNTAFNSAECNVLEDALDAAWEIFLRSGKLDRHNLDTAKAALARAILDGFENGEHNARRLAIAAVANIEQFEAQIIRQRPEKPAA